MDAEVHFLKAIAVAGGVLADFKDNSACIETININVGHRGEPKGEERVRDS